jgi:hypothetical protein
MPGQRLLTIQIESDGNVVYEGIRGVPDSTPVDGMWEVLGDVPFEPTDTQAHRTEDENANERTLNGTVVLRIKHVDKELASASVEELALHYSDGKWLLDAAEVSRIKQSAQQ